MKRIVAILIGLLLIVAIFSGGFFYSNYLVKRNQSIGEAQNAQYEKDFLEVVGLIAVNSYCSGEILAGLSSTWNSAIENGHSEMNTAISNYLEEMKDALTAMSKQDDLITGGMQKLKNYPIQYQEAYNALLEAHGVYSQLYSLAQSPTGSLMSFNNRVNDLTMEFAKVLSKLKIYMPMVKELPESVAPSEESGSGGVVDTAPAKAKQYEGGEPNGRICEKCGKEMKVFESHGQLTIEHNCNNPRESSAISSEDAATSSSMNRNSYSTSAKSPYDDESKRYRKYVCEKCGKEFSLLYTDKKSELAFVSCPHCQYYQKNNFPALSRS